MNARDVFEAEVVPRADGRVLYVGVRDYCRYPGETMDVDESVSPTFVDDICEPVNAPGETFDTVVCFGVIRYCRSPVRAMNGIRRLVKPGGKAIIGVEWSGPQDGDTKYGGDKWRFTPQGARALMSDFKITWERVFEEKTIFIEGVKCS